MGPSRPSRRPVPARPPPRPPPARSPRLQPSPSKFVCIDPSVLWCGFDLNAHCNYVDVFIVTNPYTWTKSIQAPPAQAPPPPATIAPPAAAFTLPRLVQQQVCSSACLIVCGQVLEVIPSVQPNPRSRRRRWHPLPGRLRPCSLRASSSSTSCKGPRSSTCARSAVRRCRGAAASAPEVAAPMQAAAHFSNYSSEHPNGCTTNETERQPDGEKVYRRTEQRRQTKKGIKSHRDKTWGKASF